MALPRPSYQMRSNSYTSETDSEGQARARSSLVLPDGQVRQSRISFAETTRPDRRSRLSLGGDLRPTVSNHSGSASVSNFGLGAIFKLPGASKSASALDATPAHKKSASYATGSAIADEDEYDVNVSPSQLQGPSGFHDNDMRRVVGNKNRTGRRSMLSIGGGHDKRRESVASALSGDDFRSAASARGSVDELRDIEKNVLARRSMINSQYSNSAQSPSFAQGNGNGQDDDQVEALDNRADSYYAQAYEHEYDSSPVPSPLPVSPAVPTQTVAYGPDQMLAVYAARGKVNAGPAAAPPASSAAPALAPPISGSAAESQIQPSQSRPGVSRLLSNLTKRNDNANANVEPAPAPGSNEMKSFVHLNNGVVSSAVVDALPPPGPGH